RRPAPAHTSPNRDRDLDTQPNALLGGPGRDERTTPGGQRSGDRGPVDPTATQPTPIQRDDSDPKFNELFGQDATAGTGLSADAGDRVTNLTAPTLPAARRPTPPKPSSRPPAQTPQRPVAAGPTLAHTDPEPTGGNSVLRWLVVVLLIAAGAAVGIMLGQALI
ncbi:MAG: hypothetical protein KY460_04960, partial [Actinobacteria bacterium]|nr:hypothetical protein [Actinomycetota bacterium]